MSEFNHLKQLDVNATSTAEYTFYDIPGEPVFIVKPTTEANKQYLNAVLKKSRSLNRAVRGKNLTAKDLSHNRDRDRELFPQFVMTGWNNVVDSDGNPAEYNMENAIKYLSAMPNWLFDGLRNFCAVPTNFTDVEVDQEDLEKNSESG